MPMKSFVATSEILKVVPQRPIQSDNGLSKMSKGVVPQPSQQKPKVKQTLRQVTEICGCGFCLWNELQ